MEPKSIPCSIAPWLTVINSRKALGFYKTAFNAVEVYRLEGEGEDLVVRLSIGGSEFWVSNGPPENKDTGSKETGIIRLILTVPDPDTLFSQALKAGAEQVYAVGEEHGWRLGRLVDPCGIHWEIGCPV
jgi:PhnB protein